MMSMPNPPSPHTFRHTYAVRSIEAGVDIYTVYRLMGHSTVSTTQQCLWHAPCSFGGVEANRQVSRDWKMLKDGFSRKGTTTHDVCRTDFPSRPQQARCG